MATLSIHTNHFAIQLIETSINGLLRYDAAHIVRLDKDIFGRNKFSFCVCIGYSGNDFIEVEEAALANPALVFDSVEAAHAAALEAVKNIVNHCEVLLYSIGQIFSGNGYAEILVDDDNLVWFDKTKCGQVVAYEGGFVIVCGNYYQTENGQFVVYPSVEQAARALVDLYFASRVAFAVLRVTWPAYISTAEDMVKRIAAEQEQAEQAILEQAEAMQFEAEVEQAEAENTETETETRQAVLGIDAWKKQATPMHFGVGSRAGVSLLAAQKMIRDGIVYDLNRLKTQLEQVDARIALLEREEAALEQRVTRLSNQDLSDFEPDKAARYIAEVCEAWLRSMLKMAGIELINLFSPYQDATDVFKIECACSIEEFRERAHNAGFRPYSIVPIKGTSRSAWLYIQIGKP